MSLPSPAAAVAAAAAAAAPCLYDSRVHLRLSHRMPPTTPKTLRKAKHGDPMRVESSNLSDRIRRAMRIVGVPETEARLRYARLFMCCLAMRGVSRRWQASWALHYIIKDFLYGNTDGPASEQFQIQIEKVENELAALCYEKDEVLK